MNRGGSGTTVIQLQSISGFAATGRSEARFTTQGHFELKRGIQVFLIAHQPVQAVRMCVDCSKRGLTLGQTDPLGKDNSQRETQLNGQLKLLETEKVGVDDGLGHEEQVGERQSLRILHMASKTLSWPFPNILSVKHLEITELRKLIN